MGTGSGSLKAAFEAFHSWTHSSVMYLNSGDWTDIEGWGEREPMRGKKPMSSRGRIWGEVGFHGD